MACNCSKTPPVRKPYSERTHDEEWLYPPCPCKERAEFGAYPAELQAHHARQHFDANAVPPTLMGRTPDALVRDQTNAILAVHKRITNLEDIVARMAIPAAQYAGDSQGSIKLAPGSVTGHAFDAPEHSNAKELPKHASELKSEPVVRLLIETEEGQRSVRIGLGQKVSIPPCKILAIITSD